MEARSEIVALGLRQLQQEVDRRDPEFWGALTGEDLAHLKSLCQRHWVNRIVSISPLRIYLCVAAVVTALGLFQWMRSSALGHHPLVAGLMEMAVVSVLGAAVITALLCLGIVALISLFRQAGPMATLAKLRPVRHAEYYAKHSLAYVSKSPRAQAYRESVLAQGRDLCVIDFEILLRLARCDAY